MSTEYLLAIYCVLILFVSVAGGLVPLVIRLTHQRMQLAISLVAGVMLGVGLLHMLPHALMEEPDHVKVIFGFVLAGFLAMFFIERFFCFHHHDVPGNGSAGDRGEHGHAQAPQHPGQAVGNRPDGAVGIRNEKHRLGWIGASIGLTLHTIIAGIALAASIEAESMGQSVAAVAGLGTFLAILLHKPFDAMTITTLMTVGGWTRGKTHIVNGLFALMVPVGVGLFYMGLSHAGDGGKLVAYALAFSAGTFLCVAMSDLLPELQFHSHDRVALSFSLLLGLSIAAGVGLIEAQGHAHHAHPLADVGHEVDNAGADHGAGHRDSDAHEEADAHQDEASAAIHSHDAHPTTGE
ncbi:MAG: ZIP family metal transporter [Thiohalocapsa sp.]